jgi:hypothetical protein
MFDLQKTDTLPCQPRSAFYEIEKQDGFKRGDERGIEFATARLAL